MTLLLYVYRPQTNLISKGSRVRSSPTNRKDLELPAETIVAEQQNRTSIDTTRSNTFNIITVSLELFYYYEKNTTGFTIIEPLVLILVSGILVSSIISGGLPTKKGREPPRWWFPLVNYLLTLGRVKK